MARVSRAELWKRGVLRHGRLKWYAGAVTFPIWWPLFEVAKLAAVGMQKLGDFGYWLERKL